MTAGNLTSIRRRAVVLCAAGLHFVWAQNGAADHYRIPDAAVVHKNMAPASRVLGRITVPHPVQFGMPNGLQVILIEDHRVPVITVQFYVQGAGPLGMPAEERPLAGITAKLLQKGANGLEEAELIKQIDNAGADIWTRADEGIGWATLSAKGLRDNFEEWFGLAAGMLIHPTLPAGAFESLKQQAREQMGRQWSSPELTASQTLQQALFPNAAVWTLQGAQALEAVTPANVAEWYTAHYVPPATILSVAGDIQVPELRSVVRQTLSQWRSAPMRTKYEDAPAVGAQHLFTMERPNSVQATIYIGAATVPRKHPDYLALEVMSRILGEGPTSRLYGSLRQQKGFTYEVGSEVVVRPDSAYWFAHTSVRSAATAECVSQLLAEVQRIRTVEVAEPELESAKRSMIADFALSLGTPPAVLEHVVMERLLGLSNGYWNDYERSLRTVRARDVLRVARKYLDDDRIKAVVVADKATLRQVREQYERSTPPRTEDSGSAGLRQP